MITRLMERSRRLVHFNGAEETDDDRHKDQKDLPTGERPVLAQVVEDKVFRTKTRRRLDERVPCSTFMNAKSQVARK